MSSSESARRPVADGAGELPPFPEGWYFFATRESILREGLIEKKWMGEEVVAWCDEEGRLCVADSVCPHLGSSLGPEVGGKVRGGRLVCPFHGFQFDAAGQCVATPNAPPPQGRQAEGLRDPGDPRHWSSPGSAAAAGLRAGASRTTRPPARSGASRASGPCASAAIPRRRPRTPWTSDTCASSTATTASIPSVRLTVDGPYLKSCFEFRRVRAILGLKDLVYEASAVTHIHGLGYSFVEIHEKTIDLRSRLWVLPTPVDGTLIDLLLVGQMREIPRPRRFFSGLGFLPGKLRRRLMNEILLSQQKQDVLQDVMIWDRKRHRAPPRLCQSDGPIGLYRRYCRQFYPDPEESAGGRSSSRASTEP